MTLLKSNFLGIPVSGELRMGSSRTDQKPVEELAPLLQALLDDPTITEFGWTQYTPYFNDGDVCEFSVGEIWVRTTEDVDSDEQEFDDYDLTLWAHPSLGRVNYEYRGEWPNREYVELGYEGPNEKRYRNAKALNEALTSGAYENALLDAFGDHALVTVREAGIEVEFYSHD
ncbi:hypothetical protein [Streptomyces sp. NBC_01751]|uniref:hypothetical protein n=1 Tax=Streptomyces sp. NBC_01751 TaxID=2975929 RepID=UPI002DD91D3B|nr:hypothetical protein [Streptomyces sp. NBC_01751]WSD24533.1 hypothetical protein OHA26_14150 [Streptomyces sp. NBC_01751]